MLQVLVARGLHLESHCPIKTPKPLVLQDAPRRSCGFLAHLPAQSLAENWHLSRVGSTQIGGQVATFHDWEQPLEGGREPK